MKIYQSKFFNCSAPHPRIILLNHFGLEGLVPCHVRGLDILSEEIIIDTPLVHFSFCFFFVLGGGGGEGGGRLAYSRLGTYSNKYVFDFVTPRGVTYQCKHRNRYKGLSLFLKTMFLSMFLFLSL